ncbi:hypothetical protein [Mycobacterium sp. 1165178.9]|nr:hypothetical protein [Mycobacterium sp. 1165178.9]
MSASYEETRQQPIAPGEAPVDSAVLSNGDVLQVGNFRLIFLTALGG